MLKLHQYNIKINNKQHSIFLKENTTIIQLAFLLGIEIPRFCYHERLTIAGNCRMCLVEVSKAAKPVAACALPILSNMEIFTETFLVKKAREGVLEFLLINHPLDCPVCDQGGECDLQDQTLIFGGDRGRFYEQKRAVRDKELGPLVKTTMNRCILCTRCVRFATEIAGVNYLGTLGRGLKTEIGTYVQNLLFSEISGNITDVCPVGALTVKPEAFNRRSWEVDFLDTIDIFDTFGSNIRINFKNYEIFRILPKLNEKLNEEWITDKVRFCYDGLSHQRLFFPLLKNKNTLKKDLQFYSVSWKSAFNLIKNFFFKNVFLLHELKGFIGNLSSVDSIFFFKKFLSFFGTTNMFLDTEFTSKISSDFLTNFICQTKTINIKFSDLCLMIGINPRVESPILNIKLKHGFKQKLVFSIGYCLNLSYKIKNIGNNSKILLNVLFGQHWICNFLYSSKKPYILIGSGLFYRSDFVTFHSFFKNKLNKFINLFNKNNWLGFNVLINNVGELNTLFVGFLKNSKKLYLNNLNNIFYLFGVDFLEKTKLNSFLIKKNYDFLIFHGFHGNKLTNYADVVLPSFSFLETSQYFLNIESLLQETQKMSFFSKNMRNDSDIFKILIIYLNFLNFYLEKDEIFISLFFNKFFKKSWIKQPIHFYLLKNKLLNNFKNTFLFKFSNNLNKFNKTNSFNYFGNVINNTYFSSLLTNYYMTDSISKLSPTMSLCTKNFVSLIFNLNNK